MGAAAPNQPAELCLLQWWSNKLKQQAALVCGGRTAGCMQELRKGRNNLWGLW
jgi:hypothetical protein